jgi:hypothetical protein
LRKALGVIARQQGLADVARVGRYSVAAGAARGYERDVAAARTAGRGELRGGLGGGRKLTLTQAVAYALEQADGDAEKPV